MPNANKLSVNGSATASQDVPAPSEVITYWSSAWADYFSSDAAVVDEEVHVLCDKIRSTLTTIEGPPAA